MYQESQYLVEVHYSFMHINIIFLVLVKCKMYCNRYTKFRFVYDFQQQCLLLIFNR